MLYSLLRRSVQQISLKIKPGSVAGTVPGALFRIPRQLTSQMRADRVHLTEISLPGPVRACLPFLRFHQSSLPRQKSIGGFRRNLKQTPGKPFHRNAPIPENLRKLLGRKSGRCKDSAPWILSAADLIPQKHGRYHGGAHSPFPKSRCHEPVRPPGGIVSDKRDLICRDTVLGRPAGRRMAFRIPGIAHLLQRRKAAVFPSVSGAVTSPAQQQITFVLPEGKRTAPAQETGISMSFVWQNIP